MMLQETDGTENYNPNAAASSLDVSTLAPSMLSNIGSISDGVIICEAKHQKVGQMFKNQKGERSVVEQGP